MRDILEYDPHCHFSSGGSGGGGGISGKIYSPSAQPQMDVNWQNILGDLQSQYQGGQSPGQVAWPGVYNITQSLLNNPYQGLDFSSATAAATFGQQNLWPMMSNAGSALYNTGLEAQPYAQQALDRGFSPAYGLAQDVGLQQAGQQAPNANALQQAGMGVLQQGFDPQQALYNRTQAQVSDQINAQLANSGLSGTPYGSSVAGNALSNFNIDWQNNQLNRMRQAGQSAAGMFGEQSAIGQSMLGDILTPANAAVQGAAGGAGAYGGLTGAMGGALGQGTNLVTQGLNNYLQYGNLPYKEYQSIYGNDLGALQNMIQLGNAQYQLPEDLMNSLQAYMQLGQSAGKAGAQIGAENYQSMMSGLGGLGSLVGGFNNAGSSGTGGLLGSLFGGGSAAAGGLDAATAETGGLYEAAMAAGSTL